MILGKVQFKLWLRFRLRSLLSKATRGLVWEMIFVLKKSHCESLVIILQVKRLPFKYDNYRNGPHCRYTNAPPHLQIYGRFFFQFWSKLPKINLGAEISRTDPSGLLLLGLKHCSISYFPNFRYNSNLRMVFSTDFDRNYQKNILGAEIALKISSAVKL